MGLAIISITAQFSINIGDVYVLTGTIGFSYYIIQVENFTKRNNIIETLVPMFVTAALIIYYIIIQQFFRVAAKKQ